MAGPSLRAWTFTSGGYPSSIQESSITVSEATLGPRQLHVRIKAAALNPVDIQIMNLPFWRFLPSSVAPDRKGLGADFAGVVEASGSDSGFKKGDEVFGMIFSLTKGVLQEVAVVDLDTAAVTLKPSSWSWSKAASLSLVWLTSRTSVASVEPWMPQTLSSSPPSGATPPKVVILGGSSGTGIYTIQIAKKRNWKVLTTCSSRNIDFVKSLGADEVVDYTSENVPSKLKDFKPDAVIDCVGGVDCIGIAKRYVTIVGDKTSRAAMGGPLAYLTHPRMVLRAVLSRLGIVDSYECVELSLKKEWLEEALELPEDRIFVDSEFSFQDVKAAYERLNTGRARGKVVVLA